MIAAAPLHEWLSFILLNFQQTIINMIAHALRLILMIMRIILFYFIIFADNYENFTCLRIDVRASIGYINKMCLQLNMFYHETTKIR